MKTANVKKSGVIHYSPNALINTPDVRDRAIIIRQALIAAGVSQREIAEKTRSKPSYICLIVNNSLNIRSTRVEREITEVTGLLFPPFISKRRRANHGL
jgi:ribosome-binding protein aMBF1 (putative translation factor)